VTGGTIVVAGALAQKPMHGGHTWVLLQYLLGFRRLGWDVLFLDRLDPETCIDAAGHPCPLDRSLNLYYLLNIMEHFGLHDAYALVCNHGQRFIGLSRQQTLERVGRSAFLLNVMGFCDDEELLGTAPRRVFLDIDPGFGQMWRELGLHDPFRGHDDFVTIGENIGQLDCAIPTCGLRWITTPQPVVLDHWPVTPARGDCFTTIAAWRGSNGPIEYGGKTYGLRVHEFRRFVALPRLTRGRFQLALDIHPSDTNDMALLDANGWQRVDPRDVAGNVWDYRTYIQGSKAEFMVAKEIYVRARSGWFSDRSICYLASGRPVLAQDTGFTHRYPTGEGLLAFATLDDAVSGTEALERDYAHHARTARTIAEEYFDSNRVLGRLLAKLGVT
jgi:hypothetical protein